MMSRLFYRRGGGFFRVIHGNGGEAKAVDYGLSLLHVLLAFRESGIEMELRAVDVRDRLEEVEDASGLTQYDT